MNHATRRGLRWTPEEDALILDPPPELRHALGRMRAGEPHYRALGARLGRTSKAVEVRLALLRTARAKAAA